MPRFTINEPHPTVAKNSFIQAGRGGAGNHIRAPVTTPATGLVTEVKPLPPTSSTRFYSGRGGAGNAHSKSERSVLQFDEEYTRKAAHESKLRGYAGRGGAGNAYSKTADGEVIRKSSIASSHRSSSSSSSERSGFLARLTSRSSKN